MAAPRPAEQFEAILMDWKDEGVDVIVSLLEESEIPGLTEAERALCEEIGVEFFSFPVRDKTVPDSADTLAVIARRLGIGSQAANRWRFIAGPGSAARPHWRPAS